MLRLGNHRHNPHGGATATTHQGVRLIDLSTQPSPRGAGLWGGHRGFGVLLVGGTVAKRSLRRVLLLSPHSGGSGAPGCTRTLVWPVLLLHSLQPLLPHQRQAVQRHRLHRQSAIAPTRPPRPHYRPLRLVLSQGLAAPGCTSPTWCVCPPGDGSRTFRLSLRLASAPAMSRTPGAANPLHPL